MLYFAKWKIIAIAAVCLLGVFLALPNVLGQGVLTSLPNWLPHKTVHLGLDLRGGAHVVLEVDRKNLVDRLSKQLMGDVRQGLRREKIGYQGLNRKGTRVSVLIRDPEQVGRAMTRLRELSQPISDIFGQAGTSNDIGISSDGSRIVAEITEPGLNDRIQRAVRQSIEIVRRRIDALGTTEPTIQQQGVGRILVQVPGLGDTERLIAILKDPAVLSFQLLCETQPQPGQPAARAPAGCEAVPSREGPGIVYNVQTSRLATVDGEDLVDAQPGFDQQTNEPIVSFRFNQSGARRFGRLTQRNVGRRFAIILNDQVVSAPVIREPILGGSGQISGGFRIEEVNNLAIVLRSGALPAKLVIVEERTVGPSLGADSIAAGQIASLIGMTAVIAFIIVSYGLFGVFANLALALNMTLIVGALSFLQATLTLPGIAGIVLTIGMAVDANVLIFERIREEVRNGKSPIAAIETGYARALGTILDANITTFIAAVILFGLGSGPIRGFAVTLGIGIITSVFTAFTVTRLIVSTWVWRTRPKQIPI